MTRIAVVYDSVMTDADEPVLGQVVEALKKGGHDAAPLGLPRELGAAIAAIESFAPEVVFNLAESMGGRNECDVHVAAILDLLGIPFTGSDVAGLMLAQDKVLSKKLFAFDSLPFPRFAAFYDEALEFKGDLRFPLFVKPIRLDASIGIDSSSVVRKSLDLLEKVRRVRMEFGGAALVEEFIEGREISVAVLGSEAPIALPPIEVDFSGFPKRRPRIMDQRAKFDETSAEYRGTKAVVAELDEGLRSELQRIAVAAYRGLRLRDYGRIDFRVDKQHHPFILEANPNPYLEKSAELSLAAAAAGLDYDALVARILEGAMERLRRRPPRTAAPLASAADAADESAPKESEAKTNGSNGSGGSNGGRKEKENAREKDGEKVAGKSH